MEEGVSGNDFHTLFLRWGGRQSQILAGFGLNYTYENISSRLKYQTINNYVYECDNLPCTEACWDILMNIAKQWCAQCQKEIDNEEMNYTIKRTEIIQEDK